MIQRILQILTGRRPIAPATASKGEIFFLRNEVKAGAPIEWTEKDEQDRRDQNWCTLAANATALINKD